MIPGSHQVSPPSSPEDFDAPPPSGKERYMPRSIVHCTPDIAFGAAMQDYILAQTRSSKKQWIYEIIQGRREVEEKIFENEHIILTPDIESNTAETVNWLAVFKDTRLHTIRDLEASHLPMLCQVKDRCVAAMAASTGFRRHEIMCYFHYLPSVFQLHLHVCAPYGQYTTPDIYKVHPIDNVISNLRIDPHFYQKATISTVVVGKGDLCSIYCRQRAR